MIFRTHTRTHTHTHTYIGIMCNYYIKSTILKAMAYLFGILSTRFFNIFCLYAQFSRLEENNSSWVLAERRPPLALPLLIRNIGTELVGDGR